MPKSELGAGFLRSEIASDVVAECLSSCTLPFPERFYYPHCHTILPEFRIRLYWSVPWFFFCSFIDSHLNLVGFPEVPLVPLGLKDWETPWEAMGVVFQISVHCCFICHPNVTAFLRHCKMKISKIKKRVRNGKDQRKHLCSLIKRLLGIVDPWIKKQARRLE